MEQATQLSPKRPKLVWVIFVLVLLTVGYTVLSLYLVLSGAIPLTAEEAKYVRSLTPFDYAVTGASSILNLAGAIALFRLRKIAFYLLTAAFVVGIVGTLPHVGDASFAAALGGPGFIGMLVGYALWGAVCVYAWRLKARGVLA